MPQLDFDIKHCTLCPRRCGVDRTSHVGVCGGDDMIRIARAALHFWEEPCISGTRGSGAIFFSGCSLGCTFCQNREISRGGVGKVVDADRFEEICRALAAKGVHNLNMVTADHQLPLILPSLQMLKKELDIPIVWNCGGYETPETVDVLADIVDVWLPDLKFADPELSERYTGRRDYFEVATAAIARMVSYSPKPTFSQDKMLVSGVMVRHLVLPGSRKDSLRIIDYLAENDLRDEILLSLMAQYTPNGDVRAPQRRITTFEYRSVTDKAMEYGFEGYFQERSSAKEEYTPPFDLEGV